MEICILGHLGPAGICNDNIEPAEVLHGFLNKANVVFLLLGVLLLAVLAFRQGRRVYLATVADLHLE